MHARTLIRAVAAACSVASFAALAAPAAAQSTPSAARTVATYHVSTRNHDRTMPSTVVLADSAGQLVADYYLAADSTAHRMGVIMYGEDLVLVGETKRGVLEMVLQNQLDRVKRGEFAGRWSRGEQESGLLRGRVKG
jgi:hypothetical protein